MKRRTIWILAAVLVLSCFGGCGLSDIRVKDDEADRQEEVRTDEDIYSIYYMNVEGNGLEKDTYTPEDDSAKVMVQEMLDILDNEEPKDEMLALLPDEVNISSYAIRKDTVVIDFNKKYRQMKTVREILARAGIVKTLIQVPGVQKVEFTVGGEALVDSKGDPIGAMDVNTFVEYTGTDINNYQYTTLTLYFTNETGDKLIPESRNVYYSSNLPLERVVMEQLLKGPRESGSYRTLSGKAGILGVTISEDICYVNFTRDFIDNALPVQENIPIYSIVNSLVDSCDVKQVQISVEGDNKVTFRETMDLNQFYKKNTKLIQTETSKKEE